MHRPRLTRRRPRATAAPLLVSALLATALGCASLAGLDEDYVLGGGAGAPTGGAATSTSPTTGLGGAGAAAGAGGAGAAGGLSQGGGGHDGGSGGGGLVDSLLLGDTLLFYGVGASPTPSHRIWEASSGLWGAPGPTVAAGAAVRWLVTPEKLRRPLVVGVVSIDGTTNARLDVLTGSNDAWSVAWSTTALGAVYGRKRGFDVEHEDSSGDSLVVYADDLGQLRYRTRSASGWSAEVGMPTSSPSGAEWVELVARPASDEIALLYSDTGHTLTAMTWDGDAWSAPTVLETNLHTIDHLAFGGAYEATSGDFVTVWGHPAAGATGFFTAVKAPSSTLYAALGMAPAPLLRPGPIRLRSEPGSDRIAMAYVEFTCAGQTCDDFIGAIWDGAAWQHATRIDDYISVSYASYPGAIPVDVAWVGPDEAVAVYTEDGQGLDWARWSSAAGWQLQTDWPTAPPLGQRVNVQALTVAGRNAALFLVSDSNGALYGKLYEGGSWADLGGSLEANLSSVPAVPFAAAMRR